MSPLVAVVTLTTPGREEFLELRKQEMRRQSYARVEHVIVPGPGKLGWKRNEGTRIADEEMKAEIVIHADDDDVMPPTSIEQRVDSLLSGAEICGTSWYHVYDLRQGYGTTVKVGRLHDGALAYWTRFWRETKYEDTLNVG